jgi:hypothetical protein
VKAKLQIPTSKLQGSTNHQPGAPSAAHIFWSLEFGVSLDVGAWNLELPSGFVIRHSDFVIS